MSQTYTPEYLADEMERFARDFSKSCGRDEMSRYAAAVRALAPERQESPTVAPERRWEYLCINGQQNILAALAAGYELAAPPYVGFCTTNGHTTSWVEAFVRTPLILAEPAVPAAAPDGELVALQRQVEAAWKVVDDFRAFIPNTCGRLPETYEWCANRLAAALELPAPEVTP